MRVLTVIACIHSKFLSFQETYESFHYTSLLYLSDYGHDFHGGRFIFVDGDNTNRTVEPRKGILATEELKMRM